LSEFSHGLRGVFKVQHSTRSLKRPPGRIPEIPTPPPQKNNPPNPTPGHPRREM